jgi:hypothetical protein
MNRSLLFFLLALLPVLGFSQINFGSGVKEYTQDFNGLPNTGGPVAVSGLPGWSFSRDTLIASDGGSNTGSMYSLGVLNETERALGSITSSGRSVSIYGAKLENRTGSAWSEIKVDYTGEMWRLGVRSLIDAPNSRVKDTLYFEYSTNATSVTDAAATWVSVGSLNFTTPDTSGTAGKREGNLSQYKTNISGSFSVAVASGADVWIRWRDQRLDLSTSTPRIGGSQDALGIDDLKIRVDETTGIKNNFNGPKFSIYPNPVRNGNLNLLMDGSVSGIAEALIYNSTGQQMSAERVVLSRNVSIATNNLPTGSYVLLLRKDGAFSSATFVVGE